MHKIIKNNVQGKRVNIIGYPFDVASLQETLETIKSAVVSDKKLRISIGNVDMIIKAKHDPKFSEVFSTADLIVADGVPILWAAKLYGKKLGGRVAGTEVSIMCGGISEEIGCKVGLMGASYEIAKRSGENIKKRYPKAYIKVYPTPYPLTPKDNVDLVKKINNDKIDILLVALGAPKQEFWIKNNLKKVSANVGIGIGSAFDIISGDKKWAPLWMRKCGLEWLHRLRLEPKRLAKRYLIEDMPFFWYLLIDVIQKRYNNN